MSAWRLTISPRQGPLYSVDLAPDAITGHAAYLIEAHLPNAAWMMLSRVEGAAPEPPAPEPEPPVDWTPRRFIERGTTIGWHAAGLGGVDAAYSAAGVAPNTLKCLADVAPLDRFTGYRVARLVDVPGGGNVENFDPTGDPVAQAQERMAALLPTMRAHDPAIFWEIMNEHKITGGAAHAQQFAEFWLEAVRIANAEGVKIAAFSFAVGQPEPEDWDAIAATGLFEVLAEGGHAIALHSGGQTDHEHAEFPYILGRAEAQLYAPHILPRHLDIPLFFTEFAPWPEQMAAPGFDAMQWIREADAYLRTLPYVAGAHLFTVSDWPPASFWPEYQACWNPVKAAIAEFTAAVADREN